MATLYSPIPGLFSRLTFAATNVVAGYLFYRSITPPHPIQRSETVRDTFVSLFGPFLVAIYRNCFLFVVLWQSLVICLPSWPVARRPDPGYPLNITLLTWNPYSAITFGAIIIASAVRLRAFKDLGTDFTFHLREPERLNTAGLYKWVQHPSYTAMLVATIASGAWFARRDGVLATLLPVQLLRNAQGARSDVLIVLGISAVAAVGTWIRVREEEYMLKQRFGKEWVEYNNQTPRFIPGVF